MTPERIAELRTRSDAALQQYDRAVKSAGSFIDVPRGVDGAAQVPVLYDAETLERVQKRVASAYDALMSVQLCDPLTMKHLLDRLDDTEAKLAKMRDAAKPFAALAGGISDSFPDKADVFRCRDVLVSWGDIRAIRDASG